MTQAQDDTFITALKLYTAGTARPSLTAYATFRAAAKTWLLTKEPPAPLPVPVLTPTSFTLGAGYGLDALIGHVTATNLPTSYEILSGNPSGYFAIWPSGNLRTSETIEVPPGSYTLEMRGVNGNGPGPSAIFKIVAQDMVVDPPPPPPPPPPPTPSTGWPDKTNTGIPSGISLVASGALTVTTPGTVISGKNITGMVNINANNVTLEKSKVRTSAFAVVRIKNGVTGTIVQDCEIDGVGSGNDGSHGILGQGTFLRNNIYNVENCITLQGDNTLIQDNYLHGMKASGAPHYDNIQIDGGISNVVIRHNTVINSYSQTATVMIDNDFGPVSNVVVDNNILVGGGYTVYVDGRFNSNPITGVSFTNNHIGGGYWGPTMFSPQSPTYTGNINDGVALSQTLGL